MNPLQGPFQPDPNVNVAVFVFDDTLVILNRPLLGGGNADAPSFGVIEFADVRAHRARNQGVNIELPYGTWVVVQSASDYLQQVVQDDEQRTVDQLSTHKHYVVSDGNHRAIDIVAREVSMRVLSGPLLPELGRLAATFAEEFS